MSWQGTLCGTFYTIPFGFSMVFTCAKANFPRTVFVEFPCAVFGTADVVVDVHLFNSNCHFNPSSYY